MRLICMNMKSNQNWTTQCHLKKNVKDWLHNNDGFLLGYWVFTITECMQNMKSYILDFAHIKYASYQKHERLKQYETFQYNAKTNQGYTSRKTDGKYLQKTLDAKLQYKRFLRAYTVYMVAIPIQDYLIMISFTWMAQNNHKINNVRFEELRYHQH